MTACLMCVSLDGMKAITIRLEDETHRAVKVRAATEGVAMEALARVWFDAYARGGTVTASTELTVRPREGGLAAGEEQRPGETVTRRLVDADGVGSTSDRRPAASPSFRPDPKVKK